MSDSRTPSTVYSDGEKFVCGNCHWNSEVNDYTHSCKLFLKAQNTQLEALLREAVDLAFNNSEQTCQYCNADSEHDSDCLVTRAKELLTSR